MDRTARSAGFEHDHGDLAVGPALVGIEVRVGVHQLRPQPRALLGTGHLGANGPPIGADLDVDVLRRVDD